ncbi:aldehyde dehydrogenase family protein [Virgibacillus halophilus]|uniref:Aldehyde dehydrogenase family protein n=1 Tax=Tigheibacillus halophilus TaxID=361280 RepID=A0ABU5C8R6_9BACI|nr:aldehyde dehydrogenase family protein [Virgibacillus halophilus]
MAQSFNVTDPATGDVIQKVTYDSEEDIKQALKRGHEAFKEWSRVNAHERSRLLKKWSQKNPRKQTGYR